LTYWLAYLRDDQNVEAEPRAGQSYDTVRDAADVLATMCDANQLREPAPPSLTEACEDYQRFREAWNALMS
jgi:hypothetical protein